MGRLTRSAGWVAILIPLQACRERAQAIQSEAELKDMVHHMMPIVAQKATIEI